jgi:hypothetical protein
MKLPMTISGSTEPVASLLDAMKRMQSEEEVTFCVENGSFVFEHRKWGGTSYVISVPVSQPDVFLTKIMDSFLVHAGRPPADPTR